MIYTLEPVDGFNLKEAVGNLSDLLNVIRDNLGTAIYTFSGHMDSLLLGKDVIDVTATVRRTGQKVFVGRITPHP